MHSPTTLARGPRLGRAGAHPRIDRVLRLLRLLRLFVRLVVRRRWRGVDRNHGLRQVGDVGLLVRPRGAVVVDRSHPELGGGVARRHHRQVEVLLAGRNPRLQQDLFRRHTQTVVDHPVAVAVRVAGHRPKLDTLGISHRSQSSGLVGVFLAARPRPKPRTASASVRYTGTSSATITPCSTSTPATATSTRYTHARVASLIYLLSFACRAFS